MTWDFFMKRIKSMHMGVAKKTQVVAKIQTEEGEVKEIPLEFKYDEQGRPYFESAEN